MNTESVHPGRDQYAGYLQGSLPDEQRAGLEQHLAICDFCRELVANLTLQMKEDSHPDTREVPDRIKVLADRLLAQSLRGRLIQLRTLENPDVGPSILMAADGEKQDRQAIESLAIVYSDNPEIVVCLMRDNNLGQHYLQVVSDDPDLYEHVLVEAPEAGRSVITDKNGRANLDAIESGSLSDLKWQIRLPEAVFELQELSFDPDSTTYRRETILDSEQGDRIRITLEGKGEGKQIELEVLELDGSTDIGPMQIVISLDDNVTTYDLNDQGTVLIDGGTRFQTLRVRLYT